MDLNRKFFQWLTLIFLSLLWGGSFILMKKGLIALNSNQVAAFRLTFAYLFFLPIAIRRLNKINKQNILPLLGVGFIGNFFPAFLFTLAETHIPSAIAGMINSTTTLFTWIIGILLYKTKVRIIQLIGILIGLIGSIGLMAQTPDEIFSGWNFYALLVVLAAIFYGANTNIVKYNLKDLDGLSISSLAFFFIGPIAIIVLLFTNPFPAFENPKIWLSLGATFVLAFFSSFIAIIIFNKMIKYTSAVFAASVTYLIPFFAIFWGVLDGEKISIIQLISMLIVILGIYLANRVSEEN